MLGMLKSHHIRKVIIKEIGWFYTTMAGIMGNKVSKRWNISQFQDTHFSHFDFSEVKVGLALDETLSAVGRQKLGCSCHRLIISKLSNYSEWHDKQQNSLDASVKKLFKERMSPPCPLTSIHWHILILSRKSSFKNGKIDILVFQKKILETYIVDHSFLFLF